MKKFIKALVSIACAVVLVAGSVAATFAYLADRTDPITNTFTAGNISITLKETTGSDYKMVPGTKIDKDPTITVAAESEDCWLFVKVEESANFDTYLTYAVAYGWTELAGVAGVYYRIVKNTDATKEFSVLAGDALTAKAEVTTALYREIATENKPTLTFTAYAVQYAGFESNVAGAWAIAAALPDNS